MTCTCDICRAADDAEALEDKARSELRGVEDFLDAAERDDDGTMVNVAHQDLDYYEERYAEAQSAAEAASRKRAEHLKRDWRQPGLFR